MVVLSFNLVEFLRHGLVHPSDSRSGIRPFLPPRLEIGLIAIEAHRASRMHHMPSGRCLHVPESVVATKNVAIIEET